MASKKPTKTTRPGAVRKAIERRMKADDSKKWYWSFPLVKVIFSVNGEVQMVERQIFNKSPHEHIPAMHLHQLMNSAAVQVLEELPPDADKATFAVLKAFVVSINPLGLMTVEEFWRGTQEPTASAADPAPVVAAGETPAGENVVPFTGNAAPPSLD